MSRVRNDRSREDKGVMSRGRKHIFREKGRERQGREEGEREEHTGLEWKRK